MEQTDIQHVSVEKEDFEDWEEFLSRSGCRKVWDQKRSVISFPLESQVEVARNMNLIQQESNVRRIENEIVKIIRLKLQLQVHEQLRFCLSGRP